MVHCKQLDLRQATKQVRELIGRASEYGLKVQIYYCTEDDEVTYDVEIRVEVYGETNWIVTDTYDNEQDAVKRAKAVYKSLNNNLYLSTSEIEVYS